MAIKSGVCSIPGCGWAKRVHKGLCNAHYLRLRRHGHPLRGDEPTRSKIETAPRVDGEVAYVPLTGGHLAVIDAADAKLVGIFPWHAVVDGNTIYALASVVQPDGSRRKVGLHNYLAGEKADRIVDHIDRNGLNNRRSNLRHVTEQQNHFNQGLASNNTSGFKGARYAGWVVGHKKWRAQIVFNGEHISLGYHLTAEAAGHAYDAAALKYFGDCAFLNFPRMVA